MTLYYEDLEKGTAWECGSQSIDRESIINFAEKYDPQPMHMDESAAKNMGYDGIIASGLHTICLSNALVADTAYSDIAITAGPGMENAVHTHPVRPGDTISVRAEVTRRRALESRPEEGLVGIEQQVSNQDGKQTTSMVGLLFIQARNGSK